MRLDSELARRGYRRHAAYPAATWAGLLRNSVFGFIQAYVLLAMYDGPHGTEPAQIWHRHGTGAWHQNATVS